MKAARLCRDPEFAIDSLAIDDHLAGVAEFKREDAGIDLAVDIGIRRLKCIFDRRQQRIYPFVKVALLQVNGAVHTRDTILSTHIITTRHAPFRSHSIRFDCLYWCRRVWTKRAAQAATGAAENVGVGAHAGACFRVGAVSIALEKFGVARAAPGGELMMEGVALSARKYK